MTFDKEIKELITQARTFEKSLADIEGQELIPLSFFSTSMDRLEEMKKGIHNLEVVQYQMMEDHLNNVRKEKPAPVISTPLPAVEAPVQEISKPIQEEKRPSRIEDAIIPKKEFIISLNDRFMFARDLFGGSNNELNQTLDVISDMKTLDDVLVYLNNAYAIDWDSEAGMLFRTTLEKRFAN